MTTASPPQTTSAPTGLAPGRTTVIASLALTVLAFWSTWAELPPIWNEDRTHGYVAAALSVWLIWRDRDRLTAGRDPWLLGVPLLALLSLLWMAGSVVSAQVVQIAALPVLLLLWLAVVHGLRALRPALPIAAVFSLAIPVWEVLVWPLQLLTVLFNAVAVKIVRIQAVIQGESITLPSGTLVVAGSCSGINFLMAAVTIAAVYAMLFLRETSTRWRVMGLSALMALLANWIRVFGLVVIADRSNMRSSLVRDHSTYGWIIFAMAMLVFFAVASRWERAERVLGAGDAVRPDGHVIEPSHANDDGAPRAAVFATAAAMVGPLLLFAVAQLPVAASPSGGIPGTPVTAEFRPHSTAEREWAPAYPGATESHVAHIRRGDIDIQVNRLIFREQSRDAELIGGGNRIAPDSLLLADRVIGPLDASLRMLKQAVVREGTDIRLVWYWYQVANRSTPFPMRARMMELVGFISRAPSSELVTLSTVCRREECDRAADVLKSVVIGAGSAVPPTP